MPISTFDFSRLSPQSNYVKPDNSAIENFFPNILGAYRGGQQNKIDKEVAERKKRAEELAQHFMETYGPRKEEADIALKEGMAANYGRLASGLGSPSQGGSLGETGKRFSPTYATKYAMELADAREGFLPGSNRTVLLNPDDQEEIVNRLELAAQKHGTDVQTRQRSLFAHNIDKAFNRTSIDDLTKFSGAGGTAELLKQKALDSVGKSSEDYKKYQEALTASEAEAKEIRQFLGESITPTISDQLKVMTNPTGLGVSPETARRKIEKAREIIRAQLQTYQKGLQSTEPYIGERTSPGAGMPFQGDLSSGAQDMVQIKNNKTGQVMIVPRAEAERLRGGQ